MDRRHTNMNESGMTLIEIMAAVVIATVIVAAGYTALTTTEKALTANEATVDTQQNARIAMDIISRDIKLAGFGMTQTVGNCTNAIMPSDGDSTGPDEQPDSVQLLVPTTKSSGSDRWTLSTAASAVPSGIASLTLQTGAVADMASAGMVNGSLISINGVVTATVSGTGTNSINLVTPIPPPAMFPSGAQVYLLQCIRYSVSNSTSTCGGRAPCLMRGVAGAQAALVEGIEDLQLAYACDGCNNAVNSGVADGIIDNQGGASGFDQADFLADGNWTTAPRTPDKIRLVQVSVVARQLQSNTGFGESTRAMTASTSPLSVSDHNHADGVFVAGDYGSMNPPYQNYRRRVLAKTVEARNLRQ